MIVASRAPPPRQRNRETSSPPFPMSAENRRILIIDDERPILLTLEALLGRHGYQSGGGGERLRPACVCSQSKTPALVLLDLQLPDADGLQMLEQIKAEHPETQVIILTAHDSLNNAIESIKRGAYHFISKPYAPEELLSLVEKALEKQSLLRETIELRATTQQSARSAWPQAETRLAPVFKSKAMQQIDELITAMAPSEANVLITGESGVGKEVIANVIHSRSRRADKPMVKLNCAAFPAGHDRGGIVRLRERRLHRRDERFPRDDRGSGRRHAFPRRDFRDAGGIADALSARPAGTGISPVRQHENLESGFPGRGRDQSPGAAGPGGKPAPLRSLLPAQHFPDRAAAAARTQGRHSAAGRDLREKLRPTARQTGAGDCAGSVSEIARIRLAGKRARAAKRDRIRGRARAAGSDHGEGIAGRSAAAGRPAKNRARPPQQSERPGPQA